MRFFSFLKFKIGLAAFLCLMFQHLNGNIYYCLPKYVTSWSRIIWPSSLCSFGDHHWSHLL